MKKKPRVTAAEKADLLRAIDDIKYCLDAAIANLATLRYDTKRANACAAEEIGALSQRLLFWNQQREIVEKEPTE